MDVTDETFSGTREERRRRPGDGGRRHRRPSGEAPPLPHVLGRSGKFWIIMVVYFGVLRHYEAMRVIIIVLFGVGRLGKIGGSGATRAEVHR